MSDITSLPNIGKTLAAKLNRAGIRSEQDLKECGSENALIKMATLDNSGICINMLYALEGAIQGVRWHDLSKERKLQLLLFYNTYCQQ